MRGPPLNHRHPSRQRGQSLVELALILPLLCVLLLGAADFARALSAYIALGNVAREGAHYGSMSAANAADLDGIRAAALQEAGNAIFGVTPTITRQVGIESFRDPSNEPFQYVRVEARYEFRPLFAFFRTFTMTRTVQMRVLPGF